MTDDQIIEAILRREGVYDNDPRDPGGETAYGISKRYHPDAFKNGLPTRQEAIEIYKAQYLKPWAHVEPPELRAHIADIAVNPGPSAARAMWAAANAQTARPVNTHLVIARLKYYAMRVKETPAKVRFLNGWINRAVEFL